MDEQTIGTNNPVENKEEMDPWIAAFAALEPKSEEPSEEAAGEPAGDSGAAGAGGGQLDAEAGDGAMDEDAAGGLGAIAADDGGAPASAFASRLGADIESVEQFQQQLEESNRNKAIDEIAREFIKRGIRNKNGMLGATIDDADVCKRDEDGVPHFYNPDTGQEFRGDNPRRQAQEWVEDYNKELARVFNEACRQYEDHLNKQAEPQIAVIKFAPKYEALDDIRKGMFDNIVQDYEIKNDKGEVMGYSCDLDKALALVERQVSMIQNYAKQHRQQQQQPPTGPAVDMKASGGVTTDHKQAPTSLEEAMLRKQDELLEKMKR